jgi:cholest-4-en-3-one 26-monooxygenase
VSVRQVDLNDADTFVAGVPHDWFAWLREHDPVHWNPQPGGSGFWAVTRYDDVVSVSRAPELFSSWRGSALLADLPPDDLEGMRLQLIHMDPPEHSGLRAIVSRAFTPRMIASLRDRVAELTTKIVDAVAPKGTCDFVTEIAAELPLQVIAETLGVPREDRGHLFDWSNRLIGAEDPEYGSEDAVQADITAKVALVEMFQYAHELAERKRAEPASDLCSVLVNAEVDGRRLSDVEFNMFFFLLVIAGNETTRNLISGGLLVLSEHLDQRARLLADPELLPDAVEEMLRWVSPVMQFRRTATRPTELAGTEIAEGDKVVIYYGSANRDPAAFGPDAGGFDVARSPNNHLAFGFGTHFCLGASLARLEIRAMFGELLRRLPDLAVVGPPDRLRSNFINGIKHLPVAFTPAA